jgi:hypothetical protein
MSFLCRNSSDRWAEYQQGLQERAKKLLTRRSRSRALGRGGAGPLRLDVFEDEVLPPFPRPFPWSLADDDEEEVDEEVPPLSPACCFPCLLKEEDEEEEEEEAPPCCRFPCLLEEDDDEEVLWPLEDEEEERRRLQS